MIILVIYLSTKQRKTSGGSARLAIALCIATSVAYVYTLCLIKTVLIAFMNAKEVIFYLL